MASNYDLYSPYAAQMAQQYGVPTDLFLWQIGTESSWNPSARNPTPGSTATGLAQFIAPTAASFGINPLDPYQSLQAAARYDAQLYQQTGSWPAALNAYGTTSGGTQIPSGLIPDRPDAGTATIGEETSWWSQFTKGFSSGYHDQMDGYVPPTGHDDLALSKSIPSVISAITPFIQQYAIVALGIVIVALAIWGLLRRNGTI